MKLSPEIGRRSPEEQRAYSQGYAAGRKRRDRDKADDARRAEAGGMLFEYLVAGLLLQGLTLDEILDAQIAGAKAALTSPERIPDGEALPDRGPVRSPAPASVPQ